MTIQKNQPKKIVLLDNDLNFSQFLVKELKQIQEDFGLEIVPFTNAANGILFIDKYSDQISVIIINFNIPGTRVIDLVDKIDNKNKNYQIIILADELNRNLTESFFHMNIFDVMDKKSSQAKISESVRQAHQFCLSKIEKQNRLESYLMTIRKTEMVNSNEKGSIGIFGNSEELETLKSQIRTIAQSTASVLIMGESGTGKELVARAIHEESIRKEKPYVVVNCSSYPVEQLESELFGLRKGSFAGVNYDKKGLLELADTGTIVFDEISELPLDIQGKLLRFMEDGIIQPIGSPSPVKLDIRVIASTNKDIEALVKVGDFRNDLHYRLNVLPIVVPPLRERLTDVPDLLTHFISIFNESENKSVKEFDPEIVTVFENYYWPGNIREFKNIVQRMVLFSTSEKLEVKDVPLEIQNYKTLERKDDPSSTMERPIISMREMEKRSIEKALKKANNNKELAAKALGISRASIYRKMKEYGIGG
ncbi:MAG: sigma-54-dependent Fis family transcriptional regulator [Leptospiraceae bacterium]|nr:sigma-54-dependent Fis family transcriptional regulator [Leptospiraceae bacterium]